MKIIKLLGLVLIIISASCTQRKEHSDNEIKNLAFKNATAEENPTLDYELTFIKLETSESCLINRINQIEYKKDTLFLLDFATSKLLAFNKQGAFLQAIGKKGNGPGEFVIPLSISLSKDKTKLYIVDAGQEKLIEYDSHTFEFLTEKKLKFDASCGYPLNEKCWIWNDQGYQNKEKDYHFLTTNSNFDIENHYIEKEFKSGYISGPSVSIYASNNKIYGYIPFSPVIYELSENEAVPAFRVEYENIEFPSSSYMNEISQNGSSSYFDKLSKSGYVSYNMILGANHHLLACYIVDNVKYIGFYNLQNDESHAYKLKDFAKLLKCGKFDYVSSSIESTHFVLPLSPNSLKKMEAKGYVFCDKLKEILLQTTEEDNPILCVIDMK